MIIVKPLMPIFMPLVNVRCGKIKFTGLVAPGYDMARIAAKHVMEQSCTEFAGADMSTKLKLMGVDVASVGDAHAMTPNSLSYFYADEASMTYKKIVVNA